MAASDAVPARPDEGARSVVDLIVCPSCGGHLRDDGGHARCTQGHEYRVDPAGIVHLSDRPFYYREVPQEFFAGIMDAGSADETMTAFEEAVRPLSPAQRDYIRNYALDARRGAVALLGDVGPGTTALDFGCGWGNLTRAIARLGGTAVGVDMTYESLYFSQMIRESERQYGIRAGAGLPLPFRDATFDTVFLNGVLEWLAEGFMLDEDPREVQRRFLSEFHRILRPGGRLVVAIENRHSYAYWKGAPEDHTGMRYGAVLPRRLSDLYSRKVRRKPYRTYTYTNKGYRRLLHDAGFASVAIHVPWPRYRNFDQILIGKAIRKTVVDPPRPRDGPRAFVGKRLLHGLQQVGFLEHFAQDFHIIADRDGSAGPALFERLIGRQGDTWSGTGRITVSTTGSVHFRGDRWFYKVPLDDQAERRLRSEMMNLTWLEKGPYAAWVVRDHAMHEDDGLRYATFALAPGEAATDGAAALPFLEAAAARSMVRPLEETLAWSRLRPFAERLDAQGRTDGLAARLDGAAHQEVRCGVLHGDLCRQNILVDGQACTLVDWDRAEREAPLFLDPLHLDVDAAIKGGTGLAAALEARPGTTDGLQEHTRTLLGDLTWDEAILLYLLDRMEKDSDGVGGIDRLSEKWWSVHLPVLEKVSRSMRSSAPIVG